MGAVAAFFDAITFIMNLLHFIPIIGNVIATIGNVIVAYMAWLCFYLWFKIKGVSFTRRLRTGAVSVGTFFAEMTPLLGALPFQSAGVIVQILFVWGEDRQYNKTHAAEQDAVK